jgi:hypothetical protein
LAKIVVQVQELDPGRASTYTVASYVRAVLKLRALRKEVARTLLEVERCKRALTSRLQASTLVAEAEALLDELGIREDPQ